MSETFSGFYDVIDLGGGTFQITSGYDATSTTFTDTADGADDGSIAVGDPITATVGGSFVETLIGTVPGAGVLTQTGFSGEILYSTNDSSLSIGDTISVNQTADYTFCFLAGTLIATPKGEVAVETLRRGDPIMTASGQMVSVKWVGYQKIHNSMFTSETRAPVCVSAGGLGGGLPHGDLFLTADHGLILDGLVINAGALVNGVTIRSVPLAEMPETFVYYHIETEGHEIILANGAASETFIDYATRQSFDNYAEYVALFGEEPVISEMDIPRISAARLVPPGTRARLAGDVAA